MAPVDPRMTRSLWHPSRRRIFVSYRREDTQWFAGRLADSLSAYFGDRRVFRDVDGIAGGADFGAAIHDSLTASDAVIVVIGRHWLDASDSDGRRRLDQPDDWVRQEVGTALDKGVPVFPVLVEGAPMPRTEDLPPALQKLTRFNAIPISDSRWETDTERLGKIISLDIPPVAERRLRLANVLISTLLVATIVFMLSVLVRGMLFGPNVYEGKPIASLLDLFSEHFLGSCSVSGSLAPSSLQSLQNWHTAPVFLAASCGSGLMFAFGRHVATSARKAYYAAAWVGGLGTLVGFLLYFFACPAYEAIVIFFCGMVVAPTMLALMSISGFRAR